MRSLLYHCAQAFFGMTSSMLFIAGMKTEAEFSDVYLDFIGKHGIPASLHDNVKSKINQCCPKNPLGIGYCSSRDRATQ